jgi:hypothetical protein
MYNLENASLLESHRRRDEMKSAEKHRLIKQITRGNSPENKWHRRLLAKLGTKMVTWGYRLQSHYDELLVPNVNANVSDNRMTPC